MIVLSRIPEESVMIDNCQLTVVDVTSTHALLELEDVQPFPLFRNVQGKLEPIEPNPKRKWEITLALDDPVYLSAETNFLIADLRGNKARIGFTFPAGVSVHRREIYEAIQRENSKQ